MDKKLNKENKIVAKSQTVFKFLEDKHCINIPRYQREYSWSKKNINTFLTDIHEGYYLGNVILYNGDGILEIIDGQQRLITTFLILISIRNLSDDKVLISEIEKLIYFNGKCKLQLKDRIGSDGRNILNYILDNDENIPDNVKIYYNEVKNYFLIKSFIKKTSLKDIYDKLVNSIIVEVGFHENITEAYEMFVNINTKGKPLSEIEILKSLLFKYLLSEKNSDVYKEKWQDMLKNIPEKDYTTFVSDAYLFYAFSKENVDNLKTSGSVKDNFISLLDEISDKSKALQIFNLMTDSSLENIYIPYTAVKNYELEKLKNKYYSNLNTSLSKIDKLWKLIGEFGFVQSDILFVSLFRDKEAFLTNNINYVYTFMLYIFIYEISRSIIGTSPARYSNRFKQIAKAIYNQKDPSQIKKIINEFVKEIPINYDELKTKLIGSESFIRNYKTAKYIIMLPEGNFNNGLTVEHFIYKKTKNEDEKKYVGFLGNLIPVNKDKYKDKSIKEKLILYKEDSVGDLSIKNFLMFDFNEIEYGEKIKTRTEKLSNNFVNLAKECYDNLLK